MREKVGLSAPSLLETACAAGKRYAARAVRRDQGGVGWRARSRLRVRRNQRVATPAFPQNGNGANDAEQHGGADEPLAGGAESVARVGAEPCGVEVREGQKEPEVAEAGALQHGVGGATRA